MGGGVRPAAGAGRESNFELLRIVAMFLIVWNHFFTHGAWQDPSLATSVVIQTFSFGKVGVDLFVMLTGYFMVNARFRFRSVLRVASQTVFYALAIALLSLVTGIGRPVQALGGAYAWFAVTYICLYLCIPFLNALINAISLKSYRLLLMLLLAVGSVVPSVLPFTPLASWILGESTQLPWFCVLYLFAGYLRRSEAHPSRGVTVALLAMSVVLVVLSRSVATVLAQSDDGGWPYAQWVCQRNHDGAYFPVFLLSVSLFLAFGGLRLGHVRAINVIASTTFGIYLIHDNPLVRSLLWNRFSFLDTGPVLLFFSSIAVAACVFAACSLVDLLRQRCAALLPDMPGAMMSLCARVDAAMNVDAKG